VKLALDNAHMHASVFAHTSMCTCKQPEEGHMRLPSEHISCASKIDVIMFVHASVYFTHLCSYPQDLQSHNSRFI